MGILTKESTTLDSILKNTKTTRKKNTEEIKTEALKEQLIIYQEEIIKLQKDKIQLTGKLADAKLEVMQLKMEKEIEEARKKKFYIGRKKNERSSS